REVGDDHLDAVLRLAGTGALGPVHERGRLADQRFDDRRRPGPSGVVVDALDRHRPVGETTRVHVGVVAERGDVVAVGRAGELDAVGVRRQVVAIQFDLADPTVNLAHGTAPFAAISTVNVATR